MFRSLVFRMFYCSVICSIVACSSPQKAFDNREFDKAMKLAAQKIKKGDKDQSNYDILTRSSDILVSIAKNKTSLLNESEDVDDWIEVQGEYYKTLEKVGAANIVSNGHIDSVYNSFCELKMEIDFRIIDHFYTKGKDLVHESKVTGEKSKAREGFFMFDKCIENGGENQFTDLDMLKSEAIKLGTIYFVSNGLNPAPSFWYSWLPPDADFSADCSLSYRTGFVAFSESESSSSVDNSKEIQTGTETTVDTAGISHTKNIYETVKATIKTTKVTVTASMDLYRNVENVTGQCPLSNYNFTFSESNTYEEIDVSGDERALYHLTTEKSGEPAFFRSNLKSKVENKIGDHLR